MKRIVLKEELAAITGDYKLAMVLNQMMYWSERTKEASGWVYKSGEELSEEMLMHVSGYSMRTYLKKLVTLGFLEERCNPLMKWDKTKQYRVNAAAVREAVIRAGFSVEDTPAPDLSESNEVILPSEENISPAISESTAENTFREERDADDPAAAICENLFGTLTPAIIEKLDYWKHTADFAEPGAILLHALTLAQRYEARSFTYVERILTTWQTKKLRTLEEIQRPAKKHTKSSPERVPVPKWMKEKQPVQEEDFSAEKAAAAELRQKLAEKRAMRQRKR